MKSQAVDALTEMEATPVKIMTSASSMSLSFEVWSPDPKHGHHLLGIQNLKPTPDLGKSLGILTRFPR